MLAGGTMNFNDEIRGAYNYANELLKSGDSAGDKKSISKIQRFTASV